MCVLPGTFSSPPVPRQLQTGEHYLCIWPTTEGANPIGTCEANTSTPNSMILQVSFDRRGSVVLYNNVTNTRRYTTATL